MLWHNKLFDEKHDYMRNMQTILWAMVLCLLCSCSDRGDDISGRRYPILFGSTDTRAVADITDLQDNGFKVYAYFEGSLGNASFEKEVTYNYDNDVWGYEGVQYWIPSTKYWFTAFYPTTPTAGTLTVDNTTPAQSYTIEDFDIRQQEDIMVAKAERVVGERANAPTEGSVVKLNFQHLISCVVLKINADVNVTVKDISLKYMPVVCDYSNNSWLAASGEQGNIDMTGINAQLKPASEPAEISFLVFPQTTNGVKLDVKTSDKTYKDIVIPDVTWVAGTKYTYTMTIKQNDILFDEPSVEEWDEESATGSVVIK